MKILYNSTVIVVGLQRVKDLVFTEGNYFVIVLYVVSDAV
jgi:hypothetical protein